MPNILTFPQNGSEELFTLVLKTIMGPKNITGNSLMDLCCNEAPIISKFDFAESWYMDIEPRTIPKQDRFILADVLGDHPTLSETYDIVTCLDGIEHIIKADGYRLVDRMKTLARKKAILFTPLDAWMVEAEGSDKYLNDPKSHKCVWKPNDLPDWASIVFPQYHPTLGIGAFFAWHSTDLDQDFNRVKHILERDLA